MSRYIDADNLVYAKILGISTRYAEGWNDSIDAIRECEPTADVRPNVHGEWIFIPIDDSRSRRTGDMVCVCKKCTYEIVLPFSKEPYNYCPNCGADMRKGETNGFNQETECN